MKYWTALLLALLLNACATPPEVQRPGHLFHDDLFAASSEPIRAADIFAMSDDMKRFLQINITGRLRAEGHRQALFNALYTKGQLKLDYDAALTRNASQAFEARSGNCLALVIMTAAFAKEIGLPVYYQSAYQDETWSRSGDIYFSNGHVNLSLGRKREGGDIARRYDPGHLLTIDFLPPDEIAGLRTRNVDEQTIIAMYMNNRAAESLAGGKLNDAYWWAREAITQDPGFLSSYNTLGVIYRRHQDLRAAEQAFKHVLERQSENTVVMSNLGQVLNAQGRGGDAALLAAKLKQLQPDPPFHFFNLGLSAMRAGDINAARDLFAKEVARAPYNHEFQFWLALAYLRLGSVEEARKHLALALENSTTRGERDLYAAKLEKLKRTGGR